MQYSDWGYGVAAAPAFEVIEHTADIGIRAHGHSLAQAFENAALGMFSLMASSLCQVQPTQERTIEVTARDREGLLVAWLSELLYLFEVDHLVFRHFTIHQIDDRYLKATVRGEPFDPERHQPGLGVKAITRHLLVVEETKEGYRVQVILDI